MKYAVQVRYKDGDALKFVAHTFDSRSEADDYCLSLQGALDNFLYAKVVDISHEAVSVNTGYNGYKNYETWNIALWISNDESIYHYAKQFRNKGYTAFCRDMATHCVGLAIGLETPDGISWNDPTIDIAALDALLEEL